MLIHYISIDHSYQCDRIPGKLNVKVSDGVEMEYGYQLRYNPDSRTRYAVELEQEMALESVILEAAERLANCMAENENLDGDTHRHLVGWIRDCIEITLSKYDDWRDEETKDIHRMHDEMRAQLN